LIRFVMQETRKPILDVLNGRRPERVPFWLMRQAGRYLPEYRALRETAGGFLNLVYDPEKASEVTLQPLRRFDMDAAILFSDILVIPHALGQQLAFETGDGPKLDPILNERHLARLDFARVEKHVEPIAQTVKMTRYKMDREHMESAALIGFCGSPWTVACYMVEGGGSDDFARARQWALKDPDSFQYLIDLVVESSCVYLAAQIKAGAEIIQLFESHAGILDTDQFHRWVIEPTKIIRSYLKKNFPAIPVIGFPRGADVLSWDYAVHTGVDCVGMDQMIDPFWAAENIQKIVPLQGNLDPMRLLVGGEGLEHGMERIYDAWGGKPFIFNLGHGVIKETLPENVGKLRDIVRSWKP